MIQPPDESDEPGLPARLVADLKQAEETPPVPPRVDTLILNAARRTMTRHRRVRWVVIGGTAGALAASIALVATLRSGVSPTALANTRDLNHDGRVDILDAFSLARQLENAQTLPAWDFNHDGKVDRQDVDTVASDAVK